MSRKGGYKIIDLKGLDFSEDMVIGGIHESIEDNYGKPLLFSGIVIDGVEKDDVFANAVVNGDGYDVTLYGQTLHISNVDVVSIKEWITIDFNYDELNAQVNLKSGFYDLRVETSNHSTYDFYFYFSEYENLGSSTNSFIEDAGENIVLVFCTIEGNTLSFENVNGGGEPQLEPNHNIFKLKKLF